MEVVLALVVALTMPNDKPTEYKPIRSWNTRGDLMVSAKATCDRQVLLMKEKGIKASCEVMTYDYMQKLANKN